MGWYGSFHWVYQLESLPFALLHQAALAVASAAFLIVRIPDTVGCAASRVVNNQVYLQVEIVTGAKTQFNQVKYGVLVTAIKPSCRVVLEVLDCSLFGVL